MYPHKGLALHKNVLCSARDSEMKVKAPLLRGTLLGLYGGLYVGLYERLYVGLYEGLERGIGRRVEKKKKEGHISEELYEGHEGLYVWTIGASDPHEHRTLITMDPHEHRAG